VKTLRVSTPPDPISRYSLFGPGLALCAAAILLSGCNDRARQTNPKPQVDVSGHNTAGVSTIETAEPDTSSIPVGSSSATKTAPSKLSTGEVCTSADQCQSGHCEGGCGPKEARCVERTGCTRDGRFYCGCDGKTFRASSRCPTRPYASMGRCKDGG